MSNDKLPVRAVVLQQPWAWAVIHAGKDVENRDWRPTDRRPCNLLIQAGSTYDTDGERELTEQYGIEVPLLQAQRRGVYVGIVTVPEWHIENGSRWAVDNMWHWHFTSPVPARRDVPCRGRRRVFEPGTNWVSAFSEAVVERVMLGYPAAGRRG